MATANIPDVSMSYSSALDIAKAIDDKRLDFNGMRCTLDNLVDTLNGQWEGTAQREFLTAYNKLKPKLKVISETMERYSKEIRAVVATEEDQDRASSTKFKGIDYWFRPTSNSSGSTKNDKQSKSKGGKKTKEKIKSEDTTTIIEEDFGMLRPSSRDGYFSIDGAEQYIKRQPYSGPCMAYSFAMGLSIVEHRDVDPWQYWNTKGYATPDTSKLSDIWIPVNSNTILDQIKQGKPVLMHMSHSGYGGEHWVTVCGTNASSGESIAMSNLLFMDPGAGTIRTYDELSSSYPNMKPDYMDLFL